MPGYAPGLFFLGVPMGGITFEDLEWGLAAHGFTLTRGKDHPGLEIRPKGKDYPVIEADRLKDALMFFRGVEAQKYHGKTDG